MAIFKTSLYVRQLLAQRRAEKLRGTMLPPPKSPSHVLLGGIKKNLFR